MKQMAWHWCIQCGRPFTSLESRALYDTYACRMKTWRARGMLAGTHRYVDGRFVRVAA